MIFYDFWCICLGGLAKFWDDFSERPEDFKDSKLPRNGLRRRRRRFRGLEHWHFAPQWISNKFRPQGIVNRIVDDNKKHMKSWLYIWMTLKSQAEDDKFGGAFKHWNIENMPRFVVILCTKTARPQRPSSWNYIVLAVLQQLVTSCHTRPAVSCCFPALQMCCIVLLSEGTIATCRATHVGNSLHHVGNRLGTRCHCLMGTMYLTSLACWPRQKIWSRTDCGTTRWQSWGRGVQRIWLKSGLVSRRADFLAFCIVKTSLKPF